MHRASPHVHEKLLESNSCDISLYLYITLVCICRSVQLYVFLYNNIFTRYHFHVEVQAKYCLFHFQRFSPTCSWIQPQTCIPVGVYVQTGFASFESDVVSLSVPISSSSVSALFRLKARNSLICSFLTWSSLNMF